MVLWPSSAWTMCCGHGSAVELRGLDAPLVVEGLWGYYPTLHDFTCCRTWTWDILRCWNTNQIEANPCIWIYINLNKNPLKSTSKIPAIQRLVIAPLPSPPTRSDQSHQVTALHLAAASGDLNGFKEIIEAKAQPVSRGWQVPMISYDFLYDFLPIWLHLLTFVNHDY